MKKSVGRPKQPFLDEKGRPRLRVALSPHGPTEYRAGQAIVDIVRFGGDQSAPERVLDELRKVAEIDFDVNDLDVRQAARSGYLRIRFDPDIEVGDVLRRVNTGRDAPVLLPNTVFRVGSLTADPMRFGSAFSADPMRFGSAYGADPMRFGNSNTARPSGEPTLPPNPRQKGPGRATVAILDTGLPVDGPPELFEIDFTGIGTPLREIPDLNADAYLDIAAGHTTFIRTIIERASPTVEIMCEGVIHNDGDGDEADISAALERVFDAVTDKSRLILNLSFSGYYDGDIEPPMIAFWIRALVAEGAVVVAAAGNDGRCRKKFPAAMPEVLSIGSIGACGPSPFSNHGPWLDACAPGEDLVSQFFAHFDGAFEPIVPDSVPDIDHFAGWAMWSGTSFSTPAVVGALAELVELDDCTAVQAVDKLIRTPGLFRLPDYGVVVNRVF
jgi:hypothetical protein